MANKTNPTDVGMNRTGIATSPIDARRLVEEASKIRPAPGDEQALEQIRIEYSQEAGPVGTVPPPASIKGMAQTASQAIRGHKGTVFIDKLGERLAFERGGTRLYDAVLAKAQVAETSEGSFTVSALEQIRDDEARHVGILWEAFQGVGADPTAVTPCADVVGVASSGLVQVVTDPRTTLTQALDALLLAELGDNDGWRVLIALAEGMNQGELAERFREALADEDRHLAQIRGWLAERLEIQSGATVQPEVPPPAP